MSRQDPKILARHAVEIGQKATSAGDGVKAARWFDRACRLAPNDPVLRRLRDQATPLTEMPTSAFAPPPTPPPAPSCGAAVLLVTHGMGGGVERHVTEAAAALRAQGWRPLILRPDRTGPGRVVLSEHPTAVLGRFDLPARFDALLAALARHRLDHVRFHHLLGHHPGLRALPDRLGVAFDVVVHDYALICPRLNLVGPDGMYCGEPLLAVECDACVAACGSMLDETPPVAVLRRQSAAWLAQARRVVVPTADVARRLRRHMPGLGTTGPAVEIRPWQPNIAHIVPHAFTAATPRVCIAGAIDRDKGFAVLLDCAEDAAARGLDLEFVVVGHTEDDWALLNTERVFITGPYAEPEGLALLQAQQASVGFLPSLWPETWSYALTLLWEAGLDVAAFDLGAQAERITDRAGGVLLPLGLPADRINDALIALHSKGRRHVT